MDDAARPGSDNTADVALLAAVRLWAAGLLASGGWAELLAPRPGGRGLLTMLPGIEGRCYQARGTVAGLRDAGERRTIEIVEWGTRPFGSMQNLVDLSGNIVEAERIGEQLAAWQGEHPGEPMTLLGFSGGAGVAVLAAERLPAGVTLDRLILIGAALSPKYDLSAAARRCAGGIVNFYSRVDVIILGAGTFIFGTIDRAYTPAAGCVGFCNGDDSLRCEPWLQQIGWRRDWRALGHYGGHLAWFARDWARDVLAEKIASDPPARDVTS